MSSNTPSWTASTRISTLMTSIACWTSSKWQVLAEHSDSHALLELAKVMVRSIGAADFHDAGERIALSASAGIARRPQPQGDLENWLQMGLAPVHAACELGGDRVEGRIDSAASRHSRPSVRCACVRC